VVLSFYYNYVLLQPILWTLFGVLFSYVCLYPPKVKVVKFLVWLLGPRENPHLQVVDSTIETVRDLETVTWLRLIGDSFLDYFWLVLRLFSFVFLPSQGTAASSMYFSILYRLMFFHFYRKTILMYVPDMDMYLLKGSAVFSVGTVVVSFIDRLRKSVQAGKRKKVEKRKSGTVPDRTWTVTIFDTQDKLAGWAESIRITLAKWILPQSHFIASTVVLLASAAVLTTFGLWGAYAFSDELVYMYRNISHLVRTANNYLNSFSVYTHYVDKAYTVASDWISSAVLADSASAKTKALYEYISYMSSHDEIFQNHQAIASKCSTALVGGPGTKMSDFCSLDVVRSGTVNFLFNATLAIVSAVNQDLSKLIENPSMAVSGFWELTDYYQEELQSGGTISKGGDYLLIGLNYLKQLLVHSGSISLTALGSGVSVFTFLFDSVLQALVYLTALFLLLQSQVGFYHYTAVLLHFIDPSTMLYRAIHRALRAILLSSLKMAVFHAGLTWLMFSFFNFPLVCIPTVTAFILGLVPVISPVYVAAIPLPIWTYANGDTVATVFLLVVCFIVWWSVGPSIYAEIPDSSVWMTTFSVGLGISLFGARGVIIGPMIATIPFALYGLASNYITNADMMANLNSGRFSSSPVVNKKKKSEPSIIPRMSSGDTVPAALIRGRRRKTSKPPHPVGMDQLISGVSGRAAEDRERLFEYIMTTPKNK
jgi:predicted PurR-regulated permease PerM